MVRLRPIMGWMVALLVGLAPEAFAGGLSVTEQGAAAAGKANAFAGEANDPSAIFYNPAGITQLPGTQLMIGTSIVKLDSTFRSSMPSATAPVESQLQDQFPIVPHFFITHRFKQWDERLSIGLGVYTPFGIVVDWPDNWQGRFDTIDARLRVTVYNPTVAYQVTPEFSAGAGIRIADAAAEFEQKTPPVGAESVVRVHDLTAHPIGWNVGLLYHLKEISTSVGLQFRSELQAKFTGEADFTQPLAGAVGPNAGFHTSIKFPPQLILGVSTKAIPRWTINADIEWEGWRTVGSIPKSFDGAASALNSRGLRLWKNSYVFRLGGEYAATDRLALRGGFFYDQTPIPDNTFDPTIPNADLYALTIGAGYKWQATSVDIAYLLGFYEKRAINGSTIVPDNLAGPTTFGSYSTTAQVLVLSVTHRF